jgi:hypothetical protein
MNDEPTLQTIALQVDRVINRLDSVGAGMAVFESSLARLETGVHDLEAGVGRLKAGVERLDACHGSRHQTLVSPIAPKSISKSGGSE